MTALEAFAAAFGLAGAALLALNGRHAAYGWLLFLASNAGWLTFAWLAGLHFLFIQQIGFTCTSLLGAWTWLIKPRLQRTHH